MYNSSTSSLDNVNEESNIECIVPAESFLLLGTKWTWTWGTSCPASSPLWIAINVEPEIESILEAYKGERQLIELKFLVNL